MQQKTIHRYEIIEKIGEGGMGIVYKARDPRIDRIVAIKTIKFDVGEDIDETNDKKRRFYREAKTSGQLFHQNIVTILDVDEFEDFSYIVMEYVEGVTLSRRLRGSQPLDEDDAIPIVLQVCEALQYAHNVGIIHRDIKPSNIMIIGQNQVKVADFGLAKMLSSASANITRTGGVVGTPFYMAPEQIRGEPTDARIDIFALGVVFYECLTGEKPFTGDSISTIIYKILNEDPLCIRDFNSNFSPQLDQLIRRSLAKDKDNRFTSAKEMADAIRHYYYQSKSIRERTAAIGQPTTDRLEATQEHIYPDDGYETDKPDSSRLIVKKVKTPAGNTLYLDQQSDGLLKSNKSFYIIGILLLLILIPGFIFYPNIMSMLLKDVDQPTENTLEPATSVLLTPTATAIVPGMDDNFNQQDSILPDTIMTETALPSDESEDFVREAYLRVNVTPPEAIIYLDGAELGTGEVTRKVKEGDYLIEAKLRGHETLSQQHTISGTMENPTLINLQLKPKSGFISIKTTPPHARISINQKPYGTSPLSNIKLTVGDHLVEITHSNYKKLEFTISLNPGQVLPITKKLEPSGTGSININAVPWANILIDGKDYQSTPRSIPEISSGFHTVKLVNPDYPEYMTDIEVPVGKTVKVNHNFEQANYSTIQVNADPFGTVFIDDKFEGETPISKKVKIGEHNIRISHKGHEDQTFNVTVKPGETKKITADFK